MKRKDRDGSVLSYVKVSRLLPIALMDELEPCSGCRDHCLNLAIVSDIGLAWSISWFDGTDNLSHSHMFLTKPCDMLQTPIK